MSLFLEDSLCRFSSSSGLRAVFERIEWTFLPFSSTQNQAYRTAFHTETHGLDHPHPRRKAISLCFYIPLSSPVAQYRAAFFAKSQVVIPCCTDALLSRAMVFCKVGCLLLNASRALENAVQGRGG